LKNPLEVAPGLRRSLMFQVDLLHRVLSARADAALREHDELSRRSCWILLAAKDENLSQAAIADALGVNRNVMVLELDRLEAAGWLKRVKHRDNRREQIVEPTAKGHAVLQSILAAEKLDKYRRSLVRPLTTAQVDAFERCIQSIIGAEYAQTTTKTKHKK